MKTRYLVVPVLCAMPFLDSCTTLSTSVVSFGIKSMLDVRHASESPEAYYQLGRYYQAQNRFEEAANAYERAIALKSDHVEAANGLATAYAMQGRYELAIARLEAAIERSPDVAYLHNNLGYIYYLQGRYPSAIASLEKATRLEPKNRRAWRNLALAYGKGGAPDKSRDAFVRASAPTSLTASPHREARVAGTEERANRVEQERTAQVPTVPPAVPGSSATTLITATGSMDIVAVAPNIYELRPLDRVSQVPAQEQPTTKNIATSALPSVKPSPRPYRLEVSNGNGKSGLAYRISMRLKRVGMKPVRLTNQRPWQPGSEIQYAEGYALEAAQLADLLSHEAMMVRNDRLRRDINVRLVLGKDVVDETTLVKSRDDALPVTVASLE